MGRYLGRVCQQARLLPLYQHPNPFETIHSDAGVHFAGWLLRHFAILRLPDSQQAPRTLFDHCRRWTAQQLGDCRSMVESARSTTGPTFFTTESASVATGVTCSVSLSILGDCVATKVFT